MLGLESNVGAVDGTLLKTKPENYWDFIAQKRSLQSVLDSLCRAD